MCSIMKDDTVHTPLILSKQTVHGVKCAITITFIYKMLLSGYIIYEQQQSLLSYSQYKSHNNSKKKKLPDLFEM